VDGNSPFNKKKFLPKTLFQYPKGRGNLCKLRKQQSYIKTNYAQYKRLQQQASKQILTRQKDEKRRRRIEEAENKIRERKRREFAYDSGRNSIRQRAPLVAPLDDD